MKHYKMLILLLLYIIKIINQYVNGLAKNEGRLDIQSEEEAGCCKCFKMNIKAENDLGELIYCKNCSLAFHLKCAGFTSKPKETDVYFCNICKKYVLF